MRRLFWKIFGWFWTAMVLVGLALYFLVLTGRNEDLPDDWKATTGSTLAFAGNSAVVAYEKGGSTGLDPVIDEAGKRARARFWLFSDTGKELNDAPLPPGADDGPPPDEPGPNDDGSPTGPGMPEPGGTAPDAPPIVEAALRSGTAIFRQAGPQVAAGLVVRSGTTGRTYVVMAGFPRPRFGRMTAPPQTQMLGSLVVLLLSGLVCFGLVRYLTAPLVQLREATRRLAEGDLGARTNALSRRRRDEVADLGVDFDAMAERIEGLMKAQRQLLGDISHELRSPLARMNMALALSRRTAEGIGATAAMDPVLDRISRESKRLDTLITQLLVLTRLESGEKTDYESFDLGQLVREVAEDTDFEARQSGRAVRLLRNSPHLITGSHDLWHSAIENVVRNAVRYTATGTIVEVSLHSGTDLVITVADRGPGVPEEALQNLFKPFYRVEAARDRSTGGVGLGLAIVERAIRSHGGTVTARNRPGGGLEIVLRVPMQEPAGQSRRSRMRRG